MYTSHKLFTDHINILKIAYNRCSVSLNVSQLFKGRSKFLKCSGWSRTLNPITFYKIFSSTRYIMATLFSNYTVNEEYHRGLIYRV